VSRTGNDNTNLYGGAKAEELGPRDITDNGVFPGPLTTDMAIWEERLIQKYRAQQFLKRNAEPGEVAAAVHFLAGPEGSFVSGHVINVDGGVQISLRGEIGDMIGVGFGA
jgi:3-oxoacyl-[acyl-carrier protein] reductase